MTTSLDQARIADDIEAAAYRDMYSAAPPELSEALALQSQQIDGITLLMARGITDPVFARAIGLGNDGRSDDALIERMMQTYRSADIASFWVHVNPALAPHVGAALEARGFALAKRRTWAKMLRDGSRLPSIVTSLAVREARVHERMATCTAITTAFGMPPPFTAWIDNLVKRSAWTLVTARDDERVVGGGLIYIEGTHAWLGLGGVIPDARRRNVHRVTMAARIRVALARGCTHIVTETGEPMNNEPNPSLRNMYRLGFERVASRLNYASK